jgi:hypothetical protein
VSWAVDHVRANQPRDEPRRVHQNRAAADDRVEERLADESVDPVAVPQDEEQ